MADLISVIIANYNYADYLAETIESALNQTYPNVEVIFVDDGSQDNSLEIACRYNILVLAQDNQGVSAARNNGAAHASGEFVLFLDSDDIMNPDALEKLHAQLLREGPSAGFAYGQLQYFGYKDWVFESSPFDPGKLARQNYIPASALIRKTVFDQVGGWDRGFALREDWELFIRIWHAGYRGAFLPQPHIRYRKHRPPVEIRGKNKQRKYLSVTKLAYLYPRFFWKKILKNPLRNLYYFYKFKVPTLVRHYGPTTPPRVVKQPSVREAV